MCEYIMPPNIRFHMFQAVIDLTATDTEASEADQSLNMSLVQERIRQLDADAELARCLEEQELAEFQVCYMFELVFRVTGTGCWLQISP